MKRRIEFPTSGLGERNLSRPSPCPGFVTLDPSAVPPAAVAGLEVRPRPRHQIERQADSRKPRRQLDQKRRPNRTIIDQGALIEDDCPLPD